MKKAKGAAAGLLIAGLLVTAAVTEVRAENIVQNPSVEDEEIISNED